MALVNNDQVDREPARKRAGLQQTDSTEAVAHAPTSELKRERDKRPLRERLAELAEKTRAMAGPNPREVTKDEIDDRWGQ